VLCLERHEDEWIIRARYTIYLRATFFFKSVYEGLQTVYIGNKLQFGWSKSNPQHREAYVCYKSATVYKISDNILIFKHILETISIVKYDQLTMILPALTRGSKGTWKSEGKLHSSNNSCSFWGAETYTWYCRWIYSLKHKTYWGHSCLYFTCWWKVCPIWVQQLYS